MILDPSNLLISIGIGIFTYVSYFYFKYFTRKNQIPGPIPLPIVGNLYQHPGNISEFSETCQKKYGDVWEFYLGHPSDKTRRVGVGRSDLLEKIYLTNSRTSNFIYRTPPNEGIDELGASSKGLFYNRNHDLWVRSR